MGKTSVALGPPCAPPDLPDDHDVKELRLAVVCYGGVSLAIYMHGITKELEKLIRASKEALTTDTNPFDATKTEFAYFNALKRKAAREGFRTRVVVDIISGTSAGGINGICLAKAIAQDSPQDGLRDLWLQNGAIIKLLAGWPPLPPLAGNRMLRWLGTAFAKMNENPKPTLMPPGLALNLFVTTTDMHGYTRRIPIENPATIETVINKCVLRFHDRDGSGNILGGDPALAWAARATSCFPGAFAATHLTDVIPPDAASSMPAEFFQEHELAETLVADTFFIDGGVLDNFPFRHAVDAIPSKPAVTEVDRKLLFIEPDPAGRQALPDGSSPGFGRTVWAGLSKLPRRQPIGDALDALMLYNERVRRIRQMILVSEDEVVANMLPLLASGFAAANAQVNSDIAGGEFAYQPYLRLKLLSVIEGMANGVCSLAQYPRRTTHWIFIRRVLFAWAQSEHLLEAQGELPPQQVEFLRTFDLGYGRRRFSFVIRRVGYFYGTEDRALLNQLKHGLYQLLCELQSVLDRPAAAELRSTVEDLFGRAQIAPYLAAHRVQPFVDENRKAIQNLRNTLGAYLNGALEGFGERTYNELETLTDGLSDAARDDIRAHYIGFPYWDLVTYPPRALSDVAELDEVEVIRVSPLDTHALVPRSPEGAPDHRAKLKGVALGHFAAFFRRQWRENDYLWGRLDGAERLLWLIEGDTDGTKEAFAAIAAEETGTLPRAKKLLRRVDEYVTGD